MSRGIGEWIDDFQLFDDRAEPAVRDDDRQRILMLRTNVNEMNVQPIDFGDELGQCVQSCLALAPVVFGAPIARERLSRRELHALVASVTVSHSGHLLLLMRLCNSVSSASGTVTS
jgi:hypothetical protein